MSYHAQNLLHIYTAEWVFIFHLNWNIMMEWFNILIKRNKEKKSFAIYKMRMYV